MSRDRRKRLGSSTAAVKARAVNSPTPGMLISRRQASDALTIRLMSPSIAANVMLTRYKGPLKLKDWAFAIAKRSTMRKARIALARRLAIIMHAMLRHGTEFKPA